MRRQGRGARVKQLRFPENFSRDRILFAQLTGPSSIQDIKLILITLDPNKQGLCRRSLRYSGPTVETFCRSLNSSSRHTCVKHSCPPAFEY